MTLPPWRPEDISDAILHRRQVPPPLIGDMDWIDLSVLEVVADEVYAMRQPRNTVLWPMILHRHGNECFRA